MKYFSLFLISLLSLGLSAQEFVTPKMLKKLRASDFVEDPINGDGVFLAKHKKTGLWGMYQAFSDKEIEEAIPMLFDSIDFFKFNAEFTGVWRNGKVGIYTSMWGNHDPKLTVECLYDDYKMISVNRTISEGGYKFTRKSNYLAVKRDGLWAYIDWLTGELKTDFLYDLEKEKMPYPDFIQTGDEN
ncbi:MAG: hypothetical protein JJU02_10270 [Cryomorphaceae bacterium]|nr:hypothetical protein [Cryomorphaceae bacterium]